jgi:formyltetrahydrofolate hydrolase
MLGGRRPGVRFSVMMPYRPGQIAKLTQAIYEKGGDITALSTFEGDSSATFIISAKIDGIEQQALQQLIEPLVIKLLEIATD